LPFSVFLNSLCVNNVLVLHPLPHFYFPCPANLAGDRTPPPFPLGPVPRFAFFGTSLFFHKTRYSIGSCSLSPWALPPFSLSTFWSPFLWEKSDPSSSAASKFIPPFKGPKTICATRGARKFPRRQIQGPILRFEPSHMFIKDFLFPSTFPFPLF